VVVVAVSLIVGLVAPEPVGAVPAVPGQAAPQPRAPVVSSPPLVLPEPSIPQTPGFVPEPWDPRMPRLAERSQDELPEFGPEMVDRRDAVTEVFANADGTDTVVMHSEPVHYQPAGSTAWEKIDNTIVADPERPGWVRNRANGWTVRFGPVGPGGTGGVELDTAVGVARWAPELPAEATGPVAPVVAGTGDATTVTYPGVWPGVDVVYAVSNIRVEEAIVVSDGARAEFPFVVEGLGMTAAAAPATVDEAVLGLAPGQDAPALGASGVAVDPAPTGPPPEVTGALAGVVAFDPLLVRDGSGRPSADAGVQTRVEPVEDSATQPAGGVQRLVVSVDEEWLAGQADAAKPVVVDPTVVIGASQMCAYGVDEEFRGCGSIATGTQYPGTGPWWNRSVAQWNYRPAVESNDVLWAGLWMNERRTDQLGNMVSSPDPEWVNLWSATAWSANGAIAGNNPGYWIDAAVSSPGGCAPFGDVCFNNLTDTVHDWQLAGVFNGSWDAKLGFSPDEADWPDLFDRYSYKQWDSFSGVSLVLNVNARTPAPTLTAPASGSLAVDTLTPTMRWAPVTDPDGDPVKYTVKIGTGTDGESGLVATSPELTGTEWQVPAGVLKDGLTYYWKVYANDTHSWTPSAVWSLTVDRRQGLGGLSPSDGVGPVSTNLVTGNPSVNVSAPDMPSVGGGVGVDFSYNGRPSLTGLVGTYREDADRDQVVDSTDPVRLVRTDAQVSFDWAEGSPSPGVPVDFFLANWSGWVRTPAGNWQFGIRADDGTRVWIDHTNVLDHWGGLNSTPEYQSGTVSGRYRIQIDYYDYVSSAYAELWVRNAADHSQAFVVPADWLSPETPDMAAGWSLQAADANAYYTRANVSEGSVALAGTDGAVSTFTKQPDGTYRPPEDVDDILAVNGDGTITVHDDTGLDYVFRPDGGLDSVTSALDDRHPAAAENHYDDKGRLDKITDRVSGRHVDLRYATSDGDTGCPNVPPMGLASQFQSEEGMLCRVSYWDGTSTDLYYFKDTDLLSHVSNPGDVWWGFSYDNRGRVVAVIDPLARDALFAGARTDSDTNRLFTQITYETTDPNAKVTSVTQPAALQADTLRAQHTYAYTQQTDGGMLVSGTATVTRAGVTGAFRSVAYDHRGRQTESTDAVGLTTKTYWDSRDLQVATETPDGLLTATLYNARHQPVDVWGPAPKAWFDWVTFGSLYALPNPAYMSQMAHSVTRYDEGITGTQVTWWNNTEFAGTPRAHNNDPGELRDWDSSGRPSGINADSVSARYTGDITLPAVGDYRLQICSGALDAALLYLDGHLLGSAFYGTTSCSDINAFAALIHAYTAGEIHQVRVDYKDFGGDDLVHLNWTGPGIGYSAVSTLTAGYSLATSTVDPDGKTTSTEYTDPTTGIGPQHGLVTKTIVDPGGLNLTDTTTYEPAGATDKYLRPLSRTLPAGAATQTTKTYYGDTQAVDNPCGTEPPDPSADDYNQGGMLKLDTAADPSGSDPAITRESRYDKSGRVAATRIGTETWTCTTYDARGRVTKVEYPPFGGQLARTVTTNYNADPDGAGPKPASALTTTVTDPTGTITTETDLLGRPVSYKDVWGNTTTFTYDQAGRETANNGPVGVGAIVKGYNNADRLASVSRNGLTLATVTYDPVSGRMSSVGYPTGTGTAGNGTTGTYTYDTFGRLAAITWTGPGNTLITKDEVGRSLGGDIIDQKTDGNDHHPGNDYTYDPAGRLIEAWTPVPAGVTTRHVCYEFGTANTTPCGAPTTPAVTAGLNTNRTRQVIEGGATTTYSYDNADRLTSAPAAGAGTISYDAHGNTTGIFGETHTYDAADRHMSTTKAGTTVTFIRDATDRIVARKVGPTVVARYGSSGSGDAPDFTTNTSNVVQEVTYSLPGGVLLTTRTAGNVWSYPNIHGDVTAIANQTGVKQLATRVYDPYGNNIAGGIPDNSAGNLDYAWLGQHQRPLETEPALQPTIEMGARQYSPLLGRFLETDPIEGGSANDYDYANGDPINQFDLKGEGCWRHPSHCYRPVTRASRGAYRAGIRAVRATAGWAGRNFSVTGLKHISNSRGFRTIYNVGKVIVKGVIGCVKGGVLGAALGGYLGLFAGVPEFGAIGGAAFGCGTGAVYQNIAPPGMSWYLPGG
jgi:RHS repeat-associated protein